MANIITVTRQDLTRTPPSKLETIGIESIFDVQPYTDANYPFINSVIYTSNNNLSALYCNETVAQVLALADPPNPIPTFPVISGWIADFDFNNAASVTTVGGKVSQIVDNIGSVASTQSNASFRPVYHATGGSNNTGYATFTGTQLLTGNLLTSSLEFTVVAIRRTNNGGVFDAELGVFENGNYADGWGIVDWQTGVAGGYLNARTALPGRDFYNWDQKWESITASHAAGSNKTYNTVTNSFFITSTNFPNAPTVNHHIGFMDAPGINGFKGDISRILVYDRQLSDAEVKSLNDYFIYAYSLDMPNQLISGGDSKMTTLGGAPSCPQQMLFDLQTSNSYTYLINTAVGGRTTTDVINALPTEVVAKYQSRIKNYYTIMIGYNDLAAGATAAFVYANIVTICQTVRAAGFKVVIMTDIYSTNAGVNTKTDTVNTSIRANWATFADALADTNALPQAQNPLDTTYFFDGLHPTAALDAIMAGLVEPLLLAL